MVLESIENAEQGIAKLEFGFEWHPNTSGRNLQGSHVITLSCNLSHLIHQVSGFTVKYIWAPSLLLFPLLQQS